MFGWMSDGISLSNATDYQASLFGPQQRTSCQLLQSVFGVTFGMIAIFQKFTALNKYKSRLRPILALMPLPIYVDTQHDLRIRLRNLTSKFILSRFITKLDDGNRIVYILLTCITYTRMTSDDIIEHSIMAPQPSIFHPKFYIRIIINIRLPKNKLDKHFSCGLYTSAYRPPLGNIQPFPTFGE